MLINSKISQSEIVKARNKTHCSIDVDVNINKNTATWILSPAMGFLDFIFQHSDYPDETSHCVNNG